MLVPKIKSITYKRLQQLQKDRNSSDARIWRKEVLARDGHRCQWPQCQETQKLQVHHIFPHSKYRARRTEVSNGISLCHRHHLGIKSRERQFELMFLQIVQANRSIQQKKLDGLNENNK